MIQYSSMIIVIQLQQSCNDDVLILQNIISENEHHCHDELTHRS